MKFLQSLVATAAVFLFLVFLVGRGIHDALLGWVISKRISRGAKSGNLIVKNKYEQIEATYENVWQFYRGKKLY